MPVTKNPVAAQLRAIVEAYKTHQDPRLLIEQSLELAEWLEQPDRATEQRLRDASAMARESRLERPRNTGGHATSILVPAAVAL